MQNTEAEDLKPIRNSLFELTRQNGDCLFRESRLVERTMKLCFSSRIVASTKELLGLMPLLVSLLTTSCLLLSSLSFCVLVFRLLLDRSGLRPRTKTKLQ
jgi:hypothetical protein